MTSTNHSPLENKNHFEKKGKMKPLDFPFLLTVLLLLFIGVMMLFSAGYAASLSKTGDSYFFIRRQIIWSFAGLAMMAFASVLTPKFYTRFIPLFYWVCIGLLILVLIIGPDAEKRWIYIGSFQFQPSEFAKLATVMMMARYMKIHRDEMHTWIKGFLIPCGLFLLPCGLVAVETHLSGAIIILGVGFIMYFVGGKHKGFCILLAALGVLALLVLALNTTYMEKRILTWLDPTSDLRGSGHQPYQSLLTIGSGGLFGLGYGKSRQKYLFLPEPQNDCIFSITSEEVGFIGVVLIIILFTFLVLRGIYIALRANNLFSSFLAMGIVTKVAIQIILNLAVVTNSIPTTGISLPFFSYGGTALFVLLAEMGLVLRVSRDSYMK